MSKADDDAAKWMEANAKWQQRNLIRAKETGTAYYINAQGDVITKSDTHPLCGKTTPLDNHD